MWMGRRYDGVMHLDALPTCTCIVHWLHCFPTPTLEMKLHCSFYIPSRKFPIDMAGFAVNIKAFTEHPDVWVGKDKDHNQVVIGYMETVFLEMLAVTHEALECRSNPEEVSGILLGMLS